MPYIKVTTDSGVKTLSFSLGESVFDILTKNGISTGAACGGKGRCGKCGVTAKPAPPPCEADKRFFTDDELARGARLSCLLFLDTDAEISLLGGGDAGFEAMSAGVSCCGKTGGSLHIAIDIGTTTVALCLTDEHENILAARASVNPQRMYGADVISRITASNEGKGEELRSLIRRFLLEETAELIKGADKERISSVVISGNTTMGHLFLGYPCETLGVFPFTPVDISLMRMSFEEAFGSALLNCETILLPGISTYVGADISSGMLYCDMDGSDETNLFIDLGTNGEMVIGRRGSFLCASTAAGPAFEGGNISCGTGSVPGAVCSVDILGESVHFKTISDAPPCGICGTGAVETVSELLKTGLMDETGMLDEEIFEDGLRIADGIYFTQKDVREMQLAKAAVRAGIETLMLRYGADCQSIKHVYVAGGFGYKLDIKKASLMGMFPAGLEDKIVPVGNSSLLGAVRFACGRQGIERIVNDTREIGLSEDKDFGELYIEHMYFGG